MAVTTEQIREIQAGLSARDPVFTDRVSDAIVATTSAPSGASAGYAINDISSGESAVYSVLAILLGASVTSCDVQWWGYYPGLDGGTWATLGAGSALTGLTKTYSELVPTGSVTRLYAQITALTDGGGGDGVRYAVGPCDPGA